MIRATLMLGLIMITTWSSYGQEAIAYGTTPKWDNPWEQQLRWNRFLLRPKEPEKPTFFLGEAKSIDRVDPSMPIAIPPQDGFSQFRVKDIPDDFPSNMPVAKLPDAVPNEPVQPKIEVVPRIQNEWPNR